MNLPRQFLKNTLTNKFNISGVGLLLMKADKDRRQKIKWAAPSELVLIAYASSEGSGEPAHPRSLAKTFAARSYKQ